MIRSTAGSMSRMMLDGVVISLDCVAHALRQRARGVRALAGEELVHHQAERVEIALHRGRLRPASCSGAMYAGVPEIVPSSSSVARAPGRSP